MVINNYNTHNNTIINSDDNSMEKIMIGLEVNDGAVEYGIVEFIKEYSDGYEIIYYAVTNKGYEINTSIILEFFRLMRVKEHMANNPNYLGIAYPDGYEYSKRVFGPKGKYKAHSINGSMIIHPSRLSEME
jgi:hypothetical protein